MGSLTFRVHAIRRMFERGITGGDVRNVITAGSVIEDYPDDEPYPSRLILGWVGERPIHVVMAENRADGEFIVVTAYIPDPEQWDEKFTRRKR